jgi:hypothetical protein
MSAANSEIDVLIVGGTFGAGGGADDTPYPFALRVSQVGTERVLDEFARTPDGHVAPRAASLDAASLDAEPLREHPRRVLHVP